MFQTHECNPVLQSFILHIQQPIKQIVLYTIK